VAQFSLIAGECGIEGFCDGSAASARFGELAGITIDPFDTLYFCDCGHGALRAMSPDGTFFMQTRTQNGKQVVLMHVRSLCGCAHRFCVFSCL
jgi:hypothetical protein